LLHGALGEGEGLFGEFVGAAGAGAKGVEDIIGSRFVMFAAGADGVDECVEDFD